MFVCMYVCEGMNRMYVNKRGDTKIISAEMMFICLYINIKAVYICMNDMTL